MRLGPPHHARWWRTATRSSTSTRWDSRSPLSLRADAPAPGLLVWFHGGGWVIGDIDSHDNICRSLTNRTGHTVLSVGYRLAPEAPFPAGLDDCVAATRWAFENAARSASTRSCRSRWRLCRGESGSCRVSPRSGTDPLPDPRVPDHRRRLEHSPTSTTVMGYGCPRPACSGSSISTSPAGRDRSTIRRCHRSWRAHEVAAGPPALVITAGFDPLCDEGVGYAERLSRPGRRPPTSTSPARSTVSSRCRISCPTPASPTPSPPKPSSTPSAEPHLRFVSAHFGITDCADTDPLLGVSARRTLADTTQALRAGRRGRRSSRTSARSGVW